MARGPYGQARGDISDGWFDSSRKEQAYPLRRVLADLAVEEMAAHVPAFYLPARASTFTW
jgi:hypothetical protein